MNHPPIAPRSLIQSDEFGLFIKRRTPSDSSIAKAIIAAVAEVEWRRRVERADKICKFYFEGRRKGVGFGLYPNDFELWADRAKWSRANDELQKANAAVDAWREWGEARLER